ncbi:MAG: polysaccharide biosynthesis protein [Planctomycetia bacterium]|nr:MAG: polysaccharide biosynthesis protein [Planctomycetia bacterium]
MTTPGTETEKQLTPGDWAFWTRTHRLALNVALHVGLFAASWFLAFGLAYNFQQFNRWFEPFFLPLLGPAVVIKLTFFVLLGAHRGWWRYVGLRDVFNVSKAAWLSFAGIFVVYFGLANARAVGLDIDLFTQDDFPDSVFVLDFAGTIALVCGTRIAVRLYHEEIRPSADGAAPRLLILGAGNAAENAVREILRMPVEQYRLVGFLDDDPAKHKARIHGVEVLGPIAMVKELCEEEDVNEVLIAMPSATAKQIRRVVDLCKEANVRFKTLPAMADLIAGRASVSQIRDVDINDLLGRAPVQLDDNRIREFIRDRAIMVTGAGGSIGSEMCRQIVRFGPQRLVLVEQAEQHLFEIDNELRAANPEISIAPYIGDIADRGRMEYIFSREKPSAVFHAAAHKHVPMMEHNPGEAIKNNVAGTRIIADAAVRHGCEKFVMISTDKAVNPTSIMGASKRVAEMYIQGLNARGNTQFVTVRFGNVLGSSGSVVPIFKDQIRRGGPVTVTHPDMVRFFMTIPEAAQLVLQSASMGHGGEIFVLDMGEPVRILDLARDLITLSGLRPGEDIEIVFSGVRPGEKLYEELSIEGEDVARTPHPKVGIWRNRPPDWDALLTWVDRTLAESDALSREELRKRLKDIVPEFHVEAPAAGAGVPKIQTVSEKTAAAAAPA